MGKKEKGGMNKLADQCKGRWPSLLPMFGLAAKYLTGHNGPCPMCGGKDRFKFDNKEGRGTYFCNACGAGDGLQLLMLVKGWTFKAMADELRQKLPQASETPVRQSITDEGRINALRAIWRASSPISSGDEAGIYLASREIDISGVKNLRFLPQCKVTAMKGSPAMVLPAMLALVYGPDHKPLTLHRTYLQNGRKAEIPSPRRMMAGETPIGSYIPLSDGDGIGVAEGIETALRASQKFNLPVWSMISDKNMIAFSAPQGVEVTDIFGDNDVKYAGQAAAYTLAHRLACKLNGNAPNVHIPLAVGTDWAD
jgi:putative DNA primase/helicase